MKIDCADPHCRVSPAARIAGLTGLFALLCVSACVMPSKVQTREPLAKPDAYATQRSISAEGGTWPDADWVRQFGDPQLSQLNKEALATNPGLAVARARIALARAQVDGANASLLPLATATGGVSRSYLSQDLQLQTPVGPTPASSAWSNPVEGLLGLTYELDIWGKNHAALAALVSENRAADADGQQARLTLTAALASTYNELARQLAMRDQLQQLAMQREALRNYAQSLLKAGLGSEVDLSRATGDLKETQIQLTQLDEQTLLTRHQLGALIGKGPDRGLDIRPPSFAKLAKPRVPDQLPANLLGRRPDIVAARWRVEAASQQVKVAKARFYPNINLSAAAGYASFGLTGSGASTAKGFSVGPAVSLPIFDAGLLRANLDANNAQYDAAVALYNQTLSAALTEIADTLASIRSAESQIALNQQALDSAQHTLALARQGYTAGLASEVTLVTAESGLVSAQLRAADLDARRRALQVTLIKALGGGFNDTAPATGKR